MSRKTATILIVSAVVLLVAGFLIFYFFFLREKGGLPPDPGTFPISGETTTVEEPPVVLEETRGDNAFKPILRRLSATPVAGAVAGGKDTTAIIRYVDTATGNVFEIPPSGGEAKRLTNTTIPKVYEALWNKTGNGVILRYLKDDEETIQTFSARLKSGTGGTEGELQGVFLPANILDLTLSPNTEEIFYTREENGGVAGVRALFAGSGRAEIWRSPVREWLASWPTTNSIILTTKPSVLAEGVSLLIDRSSGAQQVLLREIRGLTVLPSPKAKKLLYSASTDSGITLSLYTIAKKSSQPLSLATLPEKCVWTADEKSVLCGIPTSIEGGSYPDSWYQGVVSFSDAVWSISADTGNTSLVLELNSEAAQPLDVVRPFLSPDEKFLIFLNKTDGSLWSLQLKE